MVEVPCPLCGETGRTPVYPATRPDRPLTPEDLGISTSALACYDAVVRCRGCGLRYTSPRPPNAEILELYRRVADADFLHEAHARELTFARTLKRLSTLRRGAPPGRLFDAGCGQGFFMAAAQRAGWTVEGSDPSRAAAAHARALTGATVYEGAIAELSLPSASFDVVTLWDVVEHLLDPVDDINKLAAALKPGGIFALSTHDIGSLSARLLGPRYPFLMPMHVTHFTPGTTAVLFAKAGLRQVRVEEHVRWLRLGYLAKKLSSAAPRAGALAAGAFRALGVESRYIPVVGLGLFNAYGVKEPSDTAS